MKIEQLNTPTSFTVRGTHPMSGAYFDGYHFAVTTPTHASPNYSIYRSGLIINITNNNSADMTTYGVMMPFMKVISGVLYVVAPLYDGANYDVRIYRFTDYNTYTQYNSYTSSYYARPVDVFVHDSKIVFPTVSKNPTYWRVNMNYYITTSTTGSYYHFPTTSSASRIAYGGWYDGDEEWYMIVDEGTKTILFAWNFINTGSSTGDVYTVSNESLIQNDADNWAWMWAHEETFFFFDNYGGNVYRGKYDVKDTFSRILTGGDAYGQWINSSNEMVGITKLDGTTASFWKVFHEGAVEGYNDTKTVTTIAACSTYGWVYDTYYVGTEQVTYTPILTESLTERMFEAPTYKISTKETTYNQYLHLYDDSANPWFIGHLVNIVDDVNNPERVLEYGSVIAADIERKITLSLETMTDAEMITEVCSKGCVCLTDEGGSITAGGSNYSLEMNRMSFREFARWLFFRTKKLLRWNALGTLTFNTCSADSGLDIISTNIISSFSVQNETLKYGMVQLDGKGISVQAPIQDGGDDVLYDIYPTISSVSELQAIADNMAEMKFNQVNKIQVAVRDTGKMDIGELVDVLYNPTDKIDEDDSYIIIGHEYLPYADATNFQLSNALFVEKVMEGKRQVNANTTAIAEIQNDIVKIEAGTAPVPVTTHASTHGDGGSDEITITMAQVSDLDIMITSEVEDIITAELVDGQSIDNAIDTLITAHTAAEFHEENTWRGIDTSPVNGQTSESISSSWAYTHENDDDAHHDVVTLTSDFASLDGQALTINEDDIDHQQISGAGTNTHATIDSHIAATTAHGATGAVVGTTNTQTLTNKTLTTPIINQFSSSTADVIVNDYLKAKDHLTTGNSNYAITEDSIGEPYGIPSLDVGTKIDTSFIPAFKWGNYQDMWDADLAYPSGIHEVGDYYIVEDAGNGSGTAYEVGDIIIWDGEEWDMIRAYDANLFAYTLDTSYIRAYKEIVQKLEIRGKYWYEIKGVQNWGTDSNWLTGTMPSSLTKSGTFTILGIYDGDVSGVPRSLRANTGSNATYGFLHQAIDATDDLHVDTLVWNPSSGELTLMLIETEGSSYVGMYFYPSANLVIMFDDTGQISSTGSIINSTWHTFSMRVTSNIVYFYVDGLLKFTSGTIDKTYNDIQLRFNSASTYYIGGLASDAINSDYIPFSLSEDNGLGEFTLDDVTITKIQDSASGYSDEDDELMTAAVINDKVTADISTHASDDDAHHAVYEQTDADADILTHKSDADAHHAVYTDDDAVSAVETATLTLDNDMSLISGKDITINQGYMYINMNTNQAISNTGGEETLQIIQPTAGADAYMTFHVAGDFAAHFGLDGGTNRLSWGGWSAGAYSWTILDSGHDIEAQAGKHLKLSSTSFMYIGTNNWWNYNGDMQLYGSSPSITLKDTGSFSEGAINWVDASGNNEASIKMPAEMQMTINAGNRINLTRGGAMKMMIYSTYISAYGVTTRSIDFGTSTNAWDDVWADYYNEQGPKFNPKSDEEVYYEIKNMQLKAHPTATNSVGDPEYDLREFSDEICGTERHKKQYKKKVLDESRKIFKEHGFKDEDLTDEKIKGFFKTKLKREDLATELQPVWQQDPEEVDHQELGVGLSSWIANLHKALKHAQVKIEILEEENADMKARLIVIEESLGL